MDAISRRGLLTGSDLNFLQATPMSLTVLA
jgi:hypothetical protein